MNPTPFALLTQACGLSISEAADFVNTRKDTALSWSSGRRTAPPAVLGVLRGLYDRIQTAADELIETITSAPADAAIEIGYPADDHEAQALGLPCIGAWRAMAATAVAVIDRPVIFVARGSTPATAAAMDAHGQ